MNAKINPSGSITPALVKLVDVCVNWILYGPGRTLIYTFGWLILSITALTVYCYGLEAGVLVVFAVYFTVIHIALEFFSKKKSSKHPE